MITIYNLILENENFLHKHTLFATILSIRKNPEQFEAIKKMPPTTNKSEVCAFTEFVNHYAHFIKDLSRILHPINNLLKSEVPPGYWDKQCEHAFTKAKQAFCENKILAPYDPKLPVILATDASPYGVGVTCLSR